MAYDLRTRTTTLSTLILSATCSMVAAFLLLPGCQQGNKTTSSPAAEKAAVDSNATPSAPAAQKVAVGGNAASNTSAVQNTSVASQQQGGISGPQMTFEEPIHDFGDVVPGTKHTFQYKFINTGTALLKILNIKPCCGTVTKGLEEGQVFAPGKGGALDLEFTAGAEPGSVQRVVYITTNDMRQEITALTFKAEIIQQIACEPVHLRLFLRRENGGAGNLTIRSCTKEPFSITGFKSTADAIKASFDPAAKDTKFVLKLTADVEKLKLHTQGRVEILMTHPGCKGIYVDYDVLPEFTVTPPTIMLFKLKPGEAVQKDIWVLPNYDSDFEIDSVTSKSGVVRLVDKQKIKAADGPVFGLIPVDDPDRPKGDRYQYLLKLEVMPPKERATIRDKILIAVKNSDTLTVDVTGFYGTD